MDDVLFAGLLTLFAGLSTGIGSVIAFVAKRANYRFLSVATGFSAGVMLYVSFTEILGKANVGLGQVLSASGANWAVAGTFFLGVLAMLGIDFIVPSAENPHEVRSEQEIGELHSGAHPNPAHHAKLMRMGLFTALAIAIHNFPEGLATFLAALEDPNLGVAIAIAIALHNIPEGISVSVPIFYATGDRRRAFIYSFCSGLAEPIGAFLGYVILRPFISPAVMGGLFGIVAGIMVYISVDELLPTSRAYGKGHDSILGLIGGMALMALSLLLMQ